MVQWLLDPLSSFEQSCDGRMIGLDFVSGVATLSKLIEHSAADCKTCCLDVAIETLFLAGLAKEPAILFGLRRCFDDQCRLVAKGQCTERRVGVFKDSLSDPFGFPLKQNGHFGARQTIDNKISLRANTHGQDPRTCYA